MIIITESIFSTILTHFNSKGPMVKHIEKLLVDCHIPVEDTEVDIFIDFWLTNLPIFVIEFFDYGIGCQMWILGM